uniref:chloride channel protein n=1 Tax=Geomesophilobacter sediminis TaxID=2798584 RepID=UPI0038B28527
MLLGLVLYLLFRTTGHYHIEGVGYATIQDVLLGTMPQAGFLILLFALKLLATSLSLGSGASGGVFSPALFLGATLGGGYVLFLHRVLPGLDISPPAFAVAGMAGLVGASTAAPITAIVMILEMTYDYSVVIPLVMTVAMSYGVRTFFSRDSIYTLKLTRRGQYLPEGMHANVHEMKRAETIMDTALLTVPTETPVTEFAALVRDERKARWFVIEGEEGTVAVESRVSALAALAGNQSGSTAGELLRRRFSTASRDATLLQILGTMRSEETAVVAIVRAPADSSSDIVGVIGKEMVVDAMTEALDMFSQQDSGNRARNRSPWATLLRRGG